MAWQSRSVGQKYDFFFCAVILAEIVNGSSLIPEFSKRYVRHLDLVKCACIGKQTDLVRIQAADHMGMFTVHCLLISVVGRALQYAAVAEPVHDKYYFPNFHCALVVDSLPAVLNSCPPRAGKFLFNRIQIFLDHLIHGVSAGQNFFIFSDLPESLFVFLF